MKAAIPSSVGRGTDTGFTLIELMIVVSIVAILMTIATPAYQRMIDQSSLSSSTVYLTQHLEAARNFARKQGRAVSVVKLGSTAGN